MKIDQRTLDRLVDNELEPQARRAALQQLAHEPDGWQRCAMAFLEAQAFRSELQNWLQAPLAAKATQPHAEREISQQEQPSGVFGSASSVSKARHRQPGGGAYRIPSWGVRWAVAASLCFAFLLGQQLAPIRLTDPSPPLIPSIQLAENFTPGIRAGDALAPASELPRRQGEQPWAAQRAVRDWPVAQSALPRDVESSLRNLGMGIVRNRGLLPVTDAKGNQMAVPYEDVRLIPVKQSFAY